MEKIVLNDGGASFDVLLIRPARPTHLVLFAVGSGGNPERHLPLLTQLAENGCTVIAPYLERLLAPFPSAFDLALRSRRLEIALDRFSDPNLTAVGVGHSIGASLLLGLAGGQIVTQAGEHLSINGDQRLSKLVLFTPPTDFFHGPHALSAIKIPLQVWAGMLDSITPHTKIERLGHQFSSQVLFDLHIVKDAGHFSFMNDLPPHITDSIINRNDFLDGLAEKVSRFILD